MSKPHIKLVYSPWFEHLRWAYEPRGSRENLCTWAWNWCTERNSKEGRS